MKDVQDFQREVIEKSNTVPVVADFWAEWCAPCKILTPILERLAVEQTGQWELAKVNTETHVEVARQFGISGIPSVKMFVEGKVKSEFVGALPEYQVRQWLKASIPGKYDKDIETATRMIHEGRESEAETILESVCSADPGNEGARVFLARAILFSDSQRALDLVKTIEEPKFFELAEAVRTISRLLEIARHPERLPQGPSADTYREAALALINRNFDVALGLFIDIIRHERNYDDDGSRKACIAIFKILGEDHATTLNHRREFSRALY